MVCEDGCVSKNDLGCISGTCAHGVAKSSSTIGSATAAATITSYGGPPSEATAVPTSIHSSSSSPTAFAKASDSGGLSNGGITSIAVSVAGTVLSVAFGIGFKIWKYKKQQRQKHEEELQKQQSEQRGMTPTSPLSPISQPS